MRPTRRKNIPPRSTSAWPNHYGAANGSVEGTAMAAKRNCWTCTDRKVKCDRTLPTCRSCARLCLECQGYEMRLSWPRQNDRKRAVRAVIPTEPKGQPQNKYSIQSFINTTQSDVELHYPPTARHDNRSYHNHGVKFYPDMTRQPQVSRRGMDMFAYFTDVAYLGILTYSPPFVDMRKVLLRMALTRDTMSSQAILQALLAFSSLHRNGLQLEALHLKANALKALSASAHAAQSKALDTEEAAKHVAACMLLCAFELQIPSSTSGEWVSYVRAAGNLIQQAHLDRWTDEIEMGTPVDWFYYHDTMSRFTVGHWSRRLGAIADFAEATSAPINCNEHHLADSSTSTPLGVLSETFSMQLNTSDPHIDDPDYKRRLGQLQQRIKNIALTQGATTSTESATHVRPVHVQLYKNTLLIYLDRFASQSSTKEPLEHDTFHDPARSPFCDSFFPLLIMASRARSNERRLEVLEFIQRVEKRSLGTVKHLREGVRSVWVQQDLFADREVLVTYRQLLSVMITAIQGYKK